MFTEKVQFGRVFDIWILWLILVHYYLVTRNEEKYKESIIESPIRWDIYELGGSSHRNRPLKYFLNRSVSNLQN